MEDDTSVKVAVRIRPQLAKERIDMCQVCTSVTPEEAQVVMGKDKLFTFDYVLDMPSLQEDLYKTTAHDLIEGTFEGYNATIFAYGQTGSGKTYTMGSGFDVNVTEDQIGIIPRAVEHLFRGIDERKKAALEKGDLQPDFKVNAQFMELYNEEVIDLLDTTRDPTDRSKKSHIKIHEDAGGGIYCVGVTTRPVHSLQDTMQCLQIGTLSRSTASTNMNAQSSRSHAIFTLHIRQTRIVREEVEPEEEDKEIDTTEVRSEFETETLTAKFHFVDLAGSERLKRTGATGERLKEGISINCGLLALGNVISALGDKAKRVSHVPYRDSKLTRLLQDSLGGNSRTVMIACISPSDLDFMETLNTLKYANRARNIRNKVTVNQDKTSKQIGALRSEILHLQDQLNEYKSGKRMVGEDGVETINDMFQENTMLQTENDNLRQRIKTLQETIDKLRTRNIELLSASDALKVSSGDGGDTQVQGLIQGYIREIEQLRTKLMEAESDNELIRRAQARGATRMNTSMSAASANYDRSSSPSNNNDLVQIARQQLIAEKEMIRSINKDTRVSESEKGETELLNGEHNEDDAHILENGENDDDDEEDDDDLNDDETDSDIDDDCENLHEDLANLQCEMSIKEKLIDELELSQKRLHAMKAQYEDKLLGLHQQIKGTELERDRIVASLTEVETHSAEQVQKVRSEYHKKLAQMESELKKVQAAKKEHAKMLKNQTHYEKQLKTLQRDLSELKKIKVKLMYDMKEEAQKKRALEVRHSKDATKHEKEQRMMEAKMKRLENDKRQRDIVLKRKLEEIESLKKSNRLSAKASGRVVDKSGAKYVTTYARRTASKFSAKAAKNKWDNIEKSVASIITKKQTVTHMERDMDRWLREREQKGKKMERITRKKQRLEENSGSEEQTKKMTEQIEQLRADIAFTQDNINDCQANIMQMEESKQNFEEEPGSLVEKCHNLEEAKYLLEHFLSLVINKGLDASQREAENRELTAKLHQENVHSTLQRDMLQFLIVDQTGCDMAAVDDSLIRDNNDESDTYSDDEDEDDESDVFNPLTQLSNHSDKSEKLTDSTSVASHATQLAELARMQGSTDSLRDSATSLYGRSKARSRKTTTPEELLYAGSTANDVTASMPAHTLPLLPVIETPEDESKSKMAALAFTQGGAHVNQVAAPAALPIRRAARHPLDVSNHIRPQSASPSPGVSRKKILGSTRTEPASPSLGGRKLPTASPGLRRKAQSTGLSFGRQGSTSDATADVTPPGSPSTMRKSRSGGHNVFSRLSSQPTGSPSPHPSSNEDSTSADDKSTDKNHNLTPTSRSHRHSGCGVKEPTPVTKTPTTPGSERRALRRSLTETAKALAISAPAPERKNFVRTGSMRDKRSKTSAAPLLSQSSSTPRRSLPTSHSPGPVRRSVTPGRTAATSGSASSVSSRGSATTPVPPKSPGPNRKMPPSKTPTPTTPRLGRKAKPEIANKPDSTSIAPTTPRLQRKMTPSTENSTKTPTTPKFSRSKSDYGTDTPATLKSTRSKPTTPSTTRKLSSTSARSLGSESESESEAPSLLGKRRSVMSRGVIQAVSNRPNKSNPLIHAFTAAGHSRAVLHIHATDTLMFSASKDKTAKIWDLTRGEEILTLNDHPNNVNHVKYCEYSGLAFTTCAYFMKVWDPRQGNKCIRTITSAGQMSSGPMNLDSISRQISCPPGEAFITDIAINSTGSVLYSAAGNTVKIWDLRTFKVMGKLSGGHQSQIMVLAVDDTDTANGDICVVTGSKDHYIKVFELMEDSVGVIMPRCTLEPPHYDGIQCLCLMGDLLFSGSRDSCVKKWDLADEQLQHTMTNAHKDWVKGLAFMPGGNCLISGDRSGIVKLWHIDNCTQLGEMQAHRSQINSITTNSSIIFTASDDRAIHFWKARSSLEPSDASDLE